MRINSLTSAEGIRDLNALLDLERWPGMLVLPKVECAKEILQIRSVAATCGQSPVLLVILETARGVEGAPGILRDCGLGTIVGYGSADHTAETGGRMDDVSLAWARGRIINACAASGVAAVDGVFLNLSDQDGLRAETELVKRMGFAGKIAIHPDQIAAINTVFTPTHEEVERAREMIAMSQNTGSGAFSFQGKMVDAPVLAQAYRTVSAYEEDL